ncbi:hypothetical protein EDB85DRAFT_1904230 [Lactarius pseudohatsudake]|nr:hypothetical protein EDB85DRAFT_1904230 [Lactarius pseudohatsudake]
MSSRRGRGRAVVSWSCRGGRVGGVDVLRVEAVGAAESEQARRQRVMHWRHGTVGAKSQAPRDGSSGIARVHTGERRVEVGAFVLASSYCVFVFACSGKGGAKEGKSGWLMFEFEQVAVAKWRAV